MPSFSLIILPSLESTTPSSSPCAFFLRNFFKSARTDHSDQPSETGRPTPPQHIRQAAKVGAKAPGDRKRPDIPLLSLPSTIAVADARASVVLSNLVKLFSFTTCRQPRQSLAQSIMLRQTSCANDIDQPWRQSLLSRSPSTDPGPQLPSPPVKP